MKGFAECSNGNYSCYDQGYFAGMNYAGMAGTFDSGNYDRCGSLYYNGYVLHVWMHISTGKLLGTYRNVLGEDKVIDRH